MRDRFISLWRAALGRACADAAGAAWDEVVMRYGEPWRAYHTLEHISACLERFDEVQHALDDPHAVELALYYHDIIYVPDSDTNEALSARLCRARIEPWATPEFVERAVRLIDVTDYPSTVESTDEAHMTDIDLHSFGMSWDTFIADGKAVRAEHPGRPEADFYAGQTSFMRSLLGSGHFYRSAYFKEHYEATAHANIDRYLAELTGGGEQGAVAAQ